MEMLGVVSVTCRAPKGLRMPLVGELKTP